MTKGTQVKIIVDKSYYTGEFVRYYGSKIQIRLPDGKKLTGVSVNTGKRGLGSSQSELLTYLKKHPESSYRTIAADFSWPQPRAVATVKSLVSRGLITKTLVDGKNRYE